MLSDPGSRSKKLLKGVPERVLFYHRTEAVVPTVQCRFEPRAPDNPGLRSIAVLKGPCVKGSIRDPYCKGFYRGLFGLLGS